jgi:hypothetical protein
VLLILPSANTDFCIPSYRRISEQGLAKGSLLSLVSAYLASDQDTKGVVIANTGCLLFHRRSRKTITHASWNALPRRSAVLPPVRIDSIKNRVAGHESSHAHIRSIFETVLANPAVVNKQAIIEIIADSDGGEAAVHFLDQNWKAWAHRISAMALCNPLHYIDQLHNDDFKEFLEQKCRAYGLDSSNPLGTHLPAVNRDVEGFGIGCPIVSGGKADFDESVILEAALGKGGMLDFLQEVNEKADQFRNLNIDVVEEENASDDEATMESKGN